MSMFVCPRCGEEVSDAPWSKIYVKSEAHCADCAHIEKKETERKKEGKK